MRKAPNNNVKLGRESYRNSKERHDNPHQPGSADYKAWDRGWNAERRENER